MNTPFDGTHNDVVIKCARRLEEYFRPQTSHPITFDCSAYGIVQSTLKEAWSVAKNEFDDGTPVEVYEQYME